MDSKSRSELVALCKERGIRGYSGKTKSELHELLGAAAPTAAPTPAPPAPKTSKKTRGQFYTTNAAYILDGFIIPPAVRVVEPFAGKGDLLDWARQQTDAVIEAYDIEPKRPEILERDTLRNPPDYTDAWVLTNPPYLARNKSTAKEIYDAYDTNDLYKCFMISLTRSAARGGVLLIPAGFFFSPRDMDARVRGAFMERYRITRVRYFEETVFDDTTTTIVAFSFERVEGEPLREQSVPWVMRPSGTEATFTMSAEHGWIVGGDIYALPINDSLVVRRHVEGQPLKTGEQQTFMTLNALDSGTHEGRIGLSYKAGYVYPAKDCSRTYATLRITGRTLSEEEQMRLCEQFNAFVETARAETWSLFLPQFRESKEYARKRIPFDLAYRIVGHLLRAQV